MGIFVCIFLDMFVHILVHIFVHMFTRATLNRSTCSPFPRGTGKPLNPIRGRDRGLQLFPVNQEFLVGASHKLVSITSLPFLHTARRYYRLNVLVRSSDCLVVGSL